MPTITADNNNETKKREPWLWEFSYPTKTEITLKGEVIIMKSRNQQLFLLHFFNDQKEKSVPSDYYEERWIDGFMLIKRFNGDNHKWEVAVFTDTSYKNYKEAGELNQKRLL